MKGTDSVIYLCVDQDLGFNNFYKSIFACEF